MNAVSIGPLVFDATRFAAIMAILLFLLVSELVIRWQERRLPASGIGQQGNAGAWIMAALIAWLIGARIGFVADNLPIFTDHPVEALKFWQGGFWPLPGWLLAGFVAFLAWRRGGRPYLLPILSGAGVAAIGWAVLGLVLPGPVAELPRMQLAGLDDQPVMLAPDGRVTVLNLWATWCPPCRREMPMMAELATSMPEVDFIFANQGEDAAQIRNFLASPAMRGADLPEPLILRDAEGALMTEMSAIGLPSTLVFDRDGRLIDAQTGEVSRATLTGMITAAKGQH